MTLDEPVETAGLKPRRTAGYTAVPVAGEIIRRVGPLLGLRPQIAQNEVAAVSAPVATGSSGKGKVASTAINAAVTTAVQAKEPLAQE